MAEEWFYSNDGKNKLGPLSAATLRAMAESGLLLPTDMVCKTGMAKWVTANKVKGLFQHAELPPITSPPPEPVPANSPSPKSTTPIDVPPNGGRHILVPSKIVLIAGGALVGCFLLLTIVVLVLVGWTKKTDAERFVGTWKVTKGQERGRDIRDVLACRFTFTKDGNMNVHEPGKDDSGVYKIVGAGELDFGDDRDMSKAIFKFDGDDKLTLCFPDGGNAPRPKLFKSDEDNKLTLLVLERAKLGDKVSKEAVKKVKEAQGDAAGDFKMAGGGSSKNQALQVTAKEIATAYETNEVAADEKYKSNAVQITGVLISIKNDFNGRPFINVSGNHPLSGGFVCYFDDNNKGALARLVKGQIIAVEGIFYGLHAGGGLEMKNCEIVEAKPIKLQLRASELVRELLDHSQLAQAKYKGKKLTITGKVTDIRPGGDGFSSDPVVKLDGDDPIVFLRCSFDKTHTKELKGLTKGQIITVKGNNLTWDDVRGWEIAKCELVK